MKKPFEPGPISFVGHVAQDIETEKFFACAIFTQMTEAAGPKQVQFHAEALQLITIAETLLALAEKIRLVAEPIPASGKGH